MTMISLITADLQLAESTRDEYRFTIFPTLRKLIKSGRVDRLLLLGDLTEAKDRHPAALVNRIVNELATLSELVPVIILRGNHEGMTPDNPFFRFVRHIENIRWINKPTQIGNELFLPHTLNHERDWESWQQGGPLSRFDRIFAHNTFEGARGSNGRELKGIPLNVFGKGARVFSGDVHSPQITPPVEYVGAPYRVDFGDEYEPRVLIIGRCIYRSIPIHGPQKRLVTLTWPKGPAHWSAEVSAGDILKVRVHIEMRDVAKWSEIRDSIRKWGEKNRYIIHAVQPIVEYAPTSGKKQSKAVTKSDEELIRDYAKRRDLDERTLKRGLQLAKE